MKQILCKFDAELKKVNQSYTFHRGILNEKRVISKQNEAYFTLFFFVQEEIKLDRFEEQGISAKAWKDHFLSCVFLIHTLYSYFGKTIPKVQGAPS